MPNRWGFHVYDQDGNLVARFGDISGLEWGGSGEVLPENTYGFWAKREGAWLKAYTTVFYAHFGTLTLSWNPAGTGTLQAPTTYRVTIDEIFPFGSIQVPRGRIISWEFVLTFASFRFRSAGLGDVTTTGVFLRNKQLFASLNGGIAASYDYLTGPASPGIHTYTNLKLRLEYDIDMGVGDGYWNRDVPVLFTRIGMIRMFSHEVNEAPSLDLVSTAEISAPASGREREGAGVDQGGGTGTEPGGYQGSGGGGLQLV